MVSGNTKSFVLCGERKFGNNEPKIIKSVYPLNFNMVLKKCHDIMNLRK